MNKAEIVLKLIPSTILLICLFALSYYYMHNIVKEEYETRKAYDGGGNCRIVNGVLAFDKNLTLYFLKRLNYDGSNRHVVAVDEKTHLMYDNSKGSIAERNETIKHYLVKTKQYVYATYSIEKKKYIYLDDYFNKNFLSYLEMRYYYYLFGDEYYDKKNFKN